MRVFGSVAACIAVAAGVVAVHGERAEAQTSCNRACLQDVMTRFLDSLVANDSKLAPLAANVHYTEDTKELAVGEGFWKTASKLRPYRTDFLDERTGTAAVHAVVEENGTPMLFAARLKVEDRRITEIETMVVRNRAEGMLFAPESLTGPSEAMTTLPPEADLNSREEMIEIALRYPAGLRAGSFVTADVPFAEGAYRLENGVRMAGPGCTFQPPSCEQMRTQVIPTLPEVAGHVVAVDERNGTVLTRLDFGRGSFPGNAGSSLVTFEAFKIYGGQVHAVEAVFEAMPLNSPSGWGER
jgi:hypothetical protein